MKRKLNHYWWALNIAAGAMIAMTGEVGAASVFIVAAVAVDILKESSGE